MSRGHSGPFRDYVLFRWSWKDLLYRGHSPHIGEDLLLSFVCLQWPWLCCDVRHSGDWSDMIKTFLTGGIHFAIKTTHFSNLPSTHFVGPSPSPLGFPFSWFPRNSTSWALSAAHSLHHFPLQLLGFPFYGLRRRTPSRPFESSSPQQLRGWIGFIHFDPPIIANHPRYFFHCLFLPPVHFKMCLIHTLFIFRSSSRKNSRRGPRAS